jgi:TM2 domain-containing membrane protein YozV
MPEEGKTGFSESKRQTATVSEKKRLLAIVLCLGFGIFGAHRFYEGKTKSAKVMLCTIGGLGIWYVIDSVIVLFGEFTDNDGKRIKDWV